jgi:hypothetical protein
LELGFQGFDGTVGLGFLGFLGRLTAGGIVFCVVAGGGLTAAIGLETIVLTFCFLPPCLGLLSRTRLSASPATMLTLQPTLSFLKSTAVGAILDWNVRVVLVVPRVPTMTDFSLEP